MSLSCKQEATAGGHVLTCEALVADGAFRVEDTWEHVPGCNGEIAGSVLTKRTAWLNDILVTDPLRAQLLWDEACAP